MKFRDTNKGMVVSTLIYIGGCCDGATYSPEQVVMEDGERELCEFAVDLVTKKMGPLYSIALPTKVEITERKWLTASECCEVNGDKHIGWRKGDRVLGALAYYPICR